MIIAFPLHPLTVNTPRGKADVLWITDYGQESFTYFTVAQRGSGEFWTYKNTVCTLDWDETTGLGRRPGWRAPHAAEPAAEWRGTGHNGAAVMDSLPESNDKCQYCGYAKGRGL